MATFEPEDCLNVSTIIPVKYDYTMASLVNAPSHIILIQKKPRNLIDQVTKLGE